MAFNITSWGKKGRNYGRGAPPPRGSIEYIAVGDMWQAEPPRPCPLPYQSVSSSGSFYEISFTELDAADRWISNIDRSVNYTRKVHGDKIISNDDAKAWEGFMTRWIPFKGDMQLPGHFNAMLSSNKKLFDGFMNESKRFHDRFTAKGMPQVFIPYMGELVVLLRTMPKQLTVAQMISKLAAGIKCGEKMLDENSSWFNWMVRKDTRELKTAISQTKILANSYSPSRNSPIEYGVGQPAYDEFMRRLTLIWIQAAGLYGVTETRKTTASEFVDEMREGMDKVSPLGQGPSNALWMLVVAGAAYLGMFWLAGHKKTKITVGVPDAIPPQDQ